MQDKDLKQAQRSNLTRVVFLAICFMALFTAYASAQNLAGQLYEQLGYGNLGQVCIFFIYIFLSFASPIAAHFQSRISTKLGLIMGASPYAAFVFAGALTSFCSKKGIEDGFCSHNFIYMLNIFCSAALGTGGAFLWLFQGTYVNSCADDSTKGLFNGMFWSVFQTAQIWSSVVAATILGSTDQFTFYIILLMFALTAIIMFFFVKDPVRYTAPTPVEVSRESFGEAIAKFQELLKTKSYHFFFIGLVYSGIAIGCYIAFLGAVVATTVDSKDENVINQSTGVVFLVLAIGEVAAGLSVGKLADRFDKMKLFVISMLINEAALVFTVLACVFKSYTCALICGLLWGYGDTAIQTMINALIGSMFGGKVELYSAYRFFQCFGQMVACAIAVFIPRDSPMKYLVIITAIMLGLHTLFSKSLPRDIKSQETLITGEKKILIELDRM